MTTTDPQQAVPKTPPDFVALVSKVLDKIPADDIVSLRHKINFLQPLLFAFGHYLKEEATGDEISAIASGPWHPSFSWLKMHWFGNLDVREKEFLESIAVSYAKGSADNDFLRTFVLARLFLVPYRAPQIADWQNIPAACLKNYIDFLMDPIPLIYAGDGANYLRHMEWTLGKIHEFITAPGVDMPARNAVINATMDKFASNHLVIAGGNLLTVMKLRNKIMQYVAQDVFRCGLDWTPRPYDPGRKIRIGIISKTLMAGGETWAMLANISALDKSRYEIVVFYFNCDPGYTHDLDYYRELGRVVDRIVPLPPTDFRFCVEEIRKQDIDILWHQSHFGLMEGSHAALTFTHKLARVECAMFAMFAATTGNPYFDYFINLEPAFLPKTWENEFSERELNVKGRLIYIPDKWDERPNVIVTRENLNIPADAVVYFGGAAYAKYNGECLTAWLTIIKNVPNSYLVVYPFNVAWAPNMQGVIFYHIRLQEALDRVGVSADRIRIVSNVNGEAIIHMHSWGHIYLDSFPYGGVNSINDSIRGGLCPVASVGQSSLENGDANILTSYGLQDLIVHSIDEYIEHGIRCGTDAAYREKIRARVRQAWETKRQGFWSQVGMSHAAIIEQIVEEKFGGMADAASTARISRGGR
jgi:Glycosyl transferase family 41